MHQHLSLFLTIKGQFPHFIPVFRYEGPYFFMENYNDLIHEIKPWEQITTAKGGAYATVFHAIEAITERTTILENPFNNKTYRTMKENVPRVSNKRGFNDMFRKLKDETLRIQLLEYNGYSPQQTHKNVWEELYPLNDVEYVLRAFLNQQKRTNRISTFLKPHIKEEISHRLEGFTSITHYPPSSNYIIKVFDTERLVECCISESKGIANPDLTNSMKVKEFISILNQLSIEIGRINLSEIMGASFEGDRIISIAAPDEFISNEKVLKAYFESCSDAHVNAVPRFIFQSPKWVSRIGLSPDHIYTAYNTGNSPNLSPEEVVATGRPDFTVVDESTRTHAMAQNKLLRIEVSAIRSAFLAEISRDLVSTQGFAVPGYNIFTLLNHDAYHLNIPTPIPHANITYIGVNAGVENPSLGVPKLGQISEWAMYNALDRKKQVTEGSSLTKEVKLDSLIDESKKTKYFSSRKTIIPSNKRINKKMIKKIHGTINSTKNPLKFLLNVLKLSITLKGDKSHD